MGSNQPATKKISVRIGPGLYVASALGQEGNTGVYLTHVKQGTVLVPRKGQYGLLLVGKPSRYQEGSGSQKDSMRPGGELRWSSPGARPDLVAVKVNGQQDVRDLEEGTAVVVWPCEGGEQDAPLLKQFEELGTFVFEGPDEPQFLPANVLSGALLARAAVRVRVSAGIVNPCMFASSRYCPGPCRPKFDHIPTPGSVEVDPHLPPGDPGALR